MKTKKPDIFLGITMCLLVLTAVLCIVILWAQNSKKNNTTPTDTQPVATDTGTPIDTGTSNPSGTGTVVPPNTQPITPVELENIDEEGLKAALDDSLSGLSSEWQVMVIDPVKGTKVSSAVNCNVDDWMTANRMTQVFIMGTVFQQLQDNTLAVNDVLEDVKAMINNNDTYAADRLVEKLGGGDAARGREAVKSFAVDNGLQLGFNRPNTGSSSSKNYVTAQKTAELLNLICQGKLVSEDASKQMLEILLSPNTSPDIDVGLSGDVKYGFIHDVEDGVCICSMGVVQTPARSFVISIVCNEPVTTDGAKKKVVELITTTLPFFEK